MLRLETCFRSAFTKFESKIWVSGGAFQELNVLVSPHFRTFQIL